MRKLIESLEKHILRLQEVSAHKWQQGARNSLPDREFPNSRNIELGFDPEFYSKDEKNKILDKRFRDAQRLAYAKRVANLPLKDFDTKKIPANILKKNLRSY